MFSALSVGYLIHVLVDRGILSLPLSLARLCKILQTVALLFFIPLPSEVTYTGEVVRLVTP